MLLFVIRPGLSMTPCVFLSKSTLCLPLGAGPLSESFSALLLLSLIGPLCLCRRRRCPEFSFYVCRAVGGSDFGPCFVSIKPRGDDFKENSTSGSLTHIFNRLYLCTYWFIQDNIGEGDSFTFFLETLKTNIH